MWYDIFIRERKGALFIQIPWLPERIDFNNGGGYFASYDILDKGEVVVPAGEKLNEYEWEGIFPGAKRTDKAMLHGVWMEPNIYQKILERWKKEGTPLQLVVVGTAIVADVLLDRFEGAFTGGFGDFEYKISFIQDKDITIKTTKNTAATAKRTETQSSTKSYTIKKGDTLWEISEKFNGKGSKWEEIYDQNKTIIEKTAKDHGYKSSDHGWWIFPGCKITIRT